MKKTLNNNTKLQPPLLYALLDVVRSDVLLDPKEENRRQVSAAKEWKEAQRENFQTCINSH